MNRMFEQIMQTSHVLKPYNLWHIPYDIPLNSATMCKVELTTQHVHRMYVHTEEPALAVLSSYAPLRM